MDQPFPFGFPGPTAFYLLLYVLTFVLHHACMHYVVAGTCLVAGASIFPKCSESTNTITGLVRDWMPFLLSAAITAGVAPLLFVQIVYPVHFYTANLLLSWRWLLIIPALIVGFYLLYVIKSKLLEGRSVLVRASVVSLTAFCFLFVGCCWTANHLLANNDAQWAEIYASGDFELPAGMIVARTLVWIGGAFSSLAVIAAWQLEFTNNSANRGVSRGVCSLLARLASGGLVLGCVAGVGVMMLLEPDVRSVMTGSFGMPYLGLAIAGAVCQLAGWNLPQRSEATTRRRLFVITTGWLLTLLGVAVLRETIRISGLEMAELYARHEESAQIGGFGVFLIFAVVNTLLIGFCVWLVRRRIGDS